ncbi:pterin 4 alpha carbinolamine dehydratase-domain-containing protein [Thermothelomyces heterothallicus CBS 202.75]|uniref:pterin 4 alpha carbinolamine dehydratase-domain-containing protein n=1 Tax=Thermothelomyces heterothallicus CBS 202.75 TaxID=1149848 RepID=UPI0037420AB1
MSSSSSSSSSNQQPQFTADSDREALETFLSPLLVANGGRWALAMGGQALEREFKFKTFAKTWDFMTAVSLQCKLKNHHPEWSNVFNTTFIRWTTHHPKGLSEKDIELATICDKLATDFGEVVPVQQEQQQEQQHLQLGEACSLSGLANKAVGSAGDCCVPKTK